MIKSINLKDKLEILNIFFLSVFVFGLAKNGSDSLSNIGLMSAFAIFLFRMVIDFENVMKQYKYVILKHQKLLLLFGIFIFSILLSILFAYSSSYESLLEFKEEFFKIFIFAIIALSIQNGKIVGWILAALVLSFVYDVIIYAVKYIKHNPHLNFSRQLERKWSDYIEFLFPFVIVSIMIIRNNLVKYLLSLFLIVGIAELFLTGARGAWVSVSVEAVLFFIFIGITKKELIKKNILKIGFFVVLISLLGVYFYQNSSWVKRKFLQHTTSGRDIIVKTRLPIFLKHQNFLVGIGGPGNYQYDKFLNDYHAPKIYGRWNKEKRMFSYWADEPYLLQVFYKEGLIGLISFVLFLLYFGIVIFKKIKITNDKLQLLNLAVFVSFIGVYIVRGLVEGRNLDYLVFFIVYYILINNKEVNV